VPEITGIVVDAAGEPLVEARVYVLHGPGPVPDIAALTDSGGRFTMPLPAAGTYELGAMAGEVQGSVLVDVQDTASAELRLDV
jgi:carboxypeptidase family protein